MYEYNTVNVEILNSIAVVKFNRPKALNALSTEMTKELSDLFDKLEVNDSVRGIILTGEGKAFMAGADITEMKEFLKAESLQDCQIVRSVKLRKSESQQWAL